MALETVEQKASPGTPAWYVYEVILLLVAAGGGYSIISVIGFEMGSPIVVRAFAAGFGCLAWLLALSLGFAIRNDIKTRKGLRRLWAILAVLIGLNLLLAAAYLPMLQAWTANFQGDRLVTGTVLTPQAQQHVERRGGHMTDEDLLFDFQGNPDAVWQESILNRTVILASLAAVFIFLLILVPVLLAQLAPLLVTPKQVENSDRSA